MADSSPTPPPSPGKPVSQKEITALEKMASVQRNIPSSLGLGLWLTSLALIPILSTAGVLLVTRAEFRSLTKEISESTRAMNRRLDNVYAQMNQQSCAP